MFKNKIDQLKSWVIEQVIWAEKQLKGKTGAQKKAAVVRKLDDLIVLPFYLEWMDDKIISWLIDLACSKLNALTGHNFSNVNLDEHQEQELVEVLEAPTNFIDNLKSKIFSDRLYELFKVVKGNKEA